MNRGRCGVGLPLPLILQTDRTAVLFPPFVQAPQGSCALDWCPATRGLVSADTAFSPRSVNSRRKYPRYAEQRGVSDIHDCGKRAYIFAGFGNLQRSTDGDHFRDDAQRHDLLQHDGLSDDIVAVVHEPVHGIGGDNDYHESHGPGKRSFAKQHRGCGLHSHRPLNGPRERSIASAVPIEPQPPSFC